MKHQSCNIKQKKCLGKKKKQPLKTRRTQKLQDSIGLSWYLNTILHMNCLALHNFQNVEKQQICATSQQDRH